jgi:methylmalonyl-CoA mutase
LTTAFSPLAAGFPQAGRADWEALVEKTLKGAGAESLVLPLADGLRLLPLYPAAETTWPRLDRAGAPDGRPWDIRAPVTASEPATANAGLMADLEGAAASLLLIIDPTGARGVALSSAQTLGDLLQGVLVEIAPIALDARFLGPTAADWLNVALKGSPAAAPQFHLDPIAAFAAEGLSPGPIESHLIAAADVAARLVAIYPKAGLFRAGGEVVHEGGGSPAQELAFVLASALTYAKAMGRSGLTSEAAFSGVVLGLAADADPLMTVAKFRAARLLWSKMTRACGVEYPSVIEGRSSQRMLTRASAWTNLVRLTVAAFAAAVGGADALALGAFSDALGAPTDTARRLSRNIQLILMEEARIGAVSDPAAGSGALETLTLDLARAAWAEFNQIEARGGLIGALRDGWIARRVAQAREALAEDIASGARAIVGVTGFKAPAEAAELIEIDPTPRVSAAAPDPRKPGPDSHCPPLAAIRLESLA